MKDVTPMDQPSFGNLTGDPSVIKESSAAEFAEDVIATSRDTPVIVDFWAEWCGPCKQLGPIIEKIVLEKGGSVKLVKIDIEKYILEVETSSIIVRDNWLMPPCLPSLPSLPSLD